MRRLFASTTLSPLLLVIAACQQPEEGGSATLETDSGATSGASTGSSEGATSTTAGTQTSGGSSSSTATTANTTTGDPTAGNTTTGDPTTGTTGTTTTGVETTGLMTSTSTSTSTGNTDTWDTSAGTTEDTSTTSDSDTGDSSSTSTSTGDTSTTSGTSTGDTSTGDTDDTTGGIPECVQVFTFMETETCYSDASVQAAVAGTSLLLAGDVDNDGHVDIIVPGAVDGILVFRGDGLGGLLPPLLTPYDPARAAAIGDLDGDGRLDLAVGVPGDMPRIDLLLGDGAGSFVVEDSFPSGPTVATHMATGDFDGDGDLDVVGVHNGFEEFVPKRLSTITSDNGQTWSYGDQTLTFFVPDQTYDAWPPYLTTGVFDGVHLDVVVSTVRAVDAPQRLRSDGMGAFTHEGLLDPNHGLIGVMPLTVVDVDDDGDNEVIGAGKPGSLTMHTLNNLGGGAWGAPLTSDLTEFARQQIAVGELLQGPRPDIVYSDNNYKTMVRRIEVDGKVVSPGGFGFHIGHARTFVLADLNEDGRSDFVFITTVEPNMLALRLSE